MIKRKEYNKNILERCTELLRSHDSSEIYEGVVLSAYLIEQAFKSELRKINTLLYFDRKNITDGTAISAATGKLSKEELMRLKTITANQCVTQMCKCKEELQNYKAKFEELFKIRNFILHSTDDLSLCLDKNSASETSVSALRACRKYVVKYSGMVSDEFNPLTSSEFEKLEKDALNKRIVHLKIILKEHKKVFQRLSKQEVSLNIHNNLPKIDKYTWIEQTIRCPACKQLSFDKVGTVDFDWRDRKSVV